MITLKRPIKEYESQADSFKQEFIENGETTINGSELLDHSSWSSCQLLMKLVSGR